MNIKNCMAVGSRANSKSTVNNKIEVKFGELIDVFIAMNLLCKQKKINSEFMERNGDLNSFLALFIVVPLAGNGGFGWENNKNCDSKVKVNR